jgi:tartrate dehydrogenase/decarboxylase/D-malate dehydrogenase
MKTYRVAVIPGDGIGREVTAAAIQALDRAAERLQFRLEREEFPWGSDHYFEHGRMMPADALDRLRAFDAIFFGAVGDPRLQDNVTLNGLLLPIRRASISSRACGRRSSIPASARRSRGSSRETSIS